MRKLLSVVGRVLEAALELVEIRESIDLLLSGLGDVIQQSASADDSTNMSSKIHGSGGGFVQYLDE